MFKKFMVLPLMLISLLAFTQPVAAERGIKSTGEQCDNEKWKGSDKHHGYDHHKRGKGGFNILMMADKIGLSDKQVKKIKDVKSSYEKARIMIDAEIEILKIELKALGHDYSTDMKVYAKKVREIEAKKSDKKIAKFKMRKDIRDIMTPAQRSKIKEYYMKKHKK